jgi:hypothetical protein
VKDFADDHAVLHRPLTTQVTSRPLSFITCCCRCKGICHDNLYMLPSTFQCSLAVPGDIDVSAAARLRGCSNRKHWFSPCCMLQGSVESMGPGACAEVCPSLILFTGQRCHRLHARIRLPIQLIDIAKCGGQSKTAEPRTLKKQITSPGDLLSLLRGATHHCVSRYLGIDLASDNKRVVNCDQRLWVMVATPTQVLRITICRGYLTNSLIICILLMIRIS